MPDLPHDPPHAGLRARFPEPDHVVGRMAGTSWDAVADNFPGLYF
jgi:hypothetical protein